MRRKKNAWCGQFELIVSGRHLADESIEKHWPFKPPMTKQLGIERYDHNRVNIPRIQGANLPSALLKKMRSMGIGGFLCCARIVKRFLAVGSGNAVVL